MEVDVGFRIGEAKRAAGIRKLWKNGGMGVKAKKMLYEGVDTALYGAETWGLREAERRRKLDIFEMGCLRSMCGLTLWNKVRNKKVRRGAHVEG